MDGNPSGSAHKRSKSSGVRSLLHRVHSTKDVHRHDGDAQDDVAASSQSAAASSQTSLTSNPASAPSLQKQANRLSKPPPHLPGTMSAPPPESAQHSSSPSPNVAAKGVTIEQSVKLFRIFEALRNGDTAAISRAVREQNGAPGEEAQEGATPTSASGGRLEGTSILHLAIQCAELPVIEFVLSSVGAVGEGGVDLNGRDRDGNTPLHIAATLGRAPAVRLLLDQAGINDSIANHRGQTPIELARTPEIFQQLQLSRSIFIDTTVRRVHELVAASDYAGLEKVLVDPRVRATLDVNGVELARDPATAESGGTLLHEAARKRDTKLIQALLMNGADPFRRDRKGKLPQDVTKDDKTRAILKRSPAAAVAQRGIQEKTILGAAAPSVGAAETPFGSKDAREMKGYLKKWTNYTSGYKLRWFVLEDGVLSYYKHQDDAGSACRGAINMKIARLHMDPQDKLRFEIHGKSSVKYHLKANHQVEAKRWYWALNNAIQWSKDEAREEEKRQKSETEALRNAKMEQIDRLHHKDPDSSSVSSSKLASRSRVDAASTLVATPGGGSKAASTMADEDEGANSTYAHSFVVGEGGKMQSHAGTATIDGDRDDDEEYPDDASSHEIQPTSKDAFNITAQSARIQLDLLGQVSSALQAERAGNPSMLLSDPTVEQALGSYEAAVGNLKGLVGDLLRISRDREAFWQYRLSREQNVRQMWEESMARVAREQEELQEKIGESELRRRKTKRALRDALEEFNIGESQANVDDSDDSGEFEAAKESGARAKDGGPEVFQAPARTATAFTSPRKKSTFAEIAEDLSDSDTDGDEEFFDAVGAGEIEAVEMPPSAAQTQAVEVPKSTEEVLAARAADISPSFKGYEEGPRKRLKMDADDRPKISLWAILKSMIGKDMTKMTLPVSFNEPTSLLQRVAEDMEYADLLDTAADRLDSTERMLYVAAFAASEYASTIGRVAKPFNPLLGETYEYARPDKGYRFFIEQVSHHPPIGAAYAESPKWEYYGESAVKSKFYGKSFDINPLGTWFLRLRPTTGGPPELYTWKKVTSSVIGIITGNPTVDNYGPMEVRNHATGETCTLDFKPRGWKASSAYLVNGKVVDARGKTRWSIGGHWNDKIYARLTPGFEDAAVAAPTAKHAPGAAAGGNDQAFLVWQANPRPAGTPFNLTPFVVTLNDPSPHLLRRVAPTDTRLRPDQRAMEDGAYERAAAEKNRVEEKQRAARRRREAAGDEFVPRWFARDVCDVTGEEYWRFGGEYWAVRERIAGGDGEGEGEGEGAAAGWAAEGLEDIF